MIFKWFVLVIITFMLSAVTGCAGIDTAYTKAKDVKNDIQEKAYALSKDKANESSEYLCNHIRKSDLDRIFGDNPDAYNSLCRSQQVVLPELVPEE